MRVLGSRGWGSRDGVVESRTGEVKEWWGSRNRVMGPLPLDPTTLDGLLLIQKKLRSEKFHFGDSLMLLPHPCLAPHHPLTGTPSSHV